MSFLGEGVDFHNVGEFGPGHLQFAGVIPQRLIFWTPKWLQYRLKACYSTKISETALNYTTNTSASLIANFKFIQKNINLSLI